MHYYETAHYEPGDTYPTATAHDTLENAIEFAETHKCTTITEVGGNWCEFGKCSFCGEWVDSCDLDTETICTDCQRAIADHSDPTPRPGDLRIMQIGFSYEVQKWSIINYDGIPDHDWKTLRTFWDEKEAKEYLEIIGR